MEPLWRMAALAVGLLALAGARARAHRVVLQDGSVFDGEVRYSRSEVIVRTREGTVTVPKWRVAGIDPARAPAPAPARRAEQAPADRAADVRRSFIQALEAPVSVQFEGRPLAEAISSVAQAAGLEVRLALEPAEANEPVTLAAEGAAAAEALDRLLEGRDVSVGMLSDGTLYVGGPRRSRAPTAEEVLSQRMDIQIEDATLDDFLNYVREVTGANMALAREVKADPEPVDLHLDDVAVATVLQVVLEPRGYVVSVRPGDILYVHAGVPGYEGVMRVYDVRDLLVSTEDLGAGGLGRGGSLGGGQIGAASRQGGLGGGFDGGFNYSPQYGGAGGVGFQGTATGFGGVGGRQGRQAGQFSPMTTRAENLILLMKQGCGADTWMIPASTGLIDASGTAGRGTLGGGTGFGP